MPDESVPHQTPSHLTRRSLLGVAGLGTVATALPGAAPAARAARPRARGAPASDLPLVGGAEFPIGIYWPPPPYETTLERYREIADAGFTFLITGNYLYDQYIIDWAMRWADETGLQVLDAGDPRVVAMTHFHTVTEDGGGHLELSRAEARDWLRQAVDLYRPHPSFAGFNFIDEPRFAQLPTVARGFELLRELAPDRLPYTNLERGISMHPDQIRQFVEIVDPPLISFDHYPLFVDGVDQTWFSDWASVRQAGLDHDLPTWTYILAVPHLSYRAPNLAEMLWQVNVSLAYGCKGIQYFTYWTPEGARGAGFAEGAGALLTLDGRRTERYAAARTINKRWLAPAGKQLKPLVSASVSVTGVPAPPDGLPAFAPDEHVAAAEGDPVVVGQLTDPATPESRWLLVVNYALDRRASTDLTLGSAVGERATDRFVPATEAYAPVRTPGRRLRVTLDPGAATLYRLGV